MSTRVDRRKHWHTREGLPRRQEHLLRLLDGECSGGGADDPADNIAFLYRIRRTGASAVANAALWWPTRRIFADASQLSDDELRGFARRLQVLTPGSCSGLRWCGLRVRGIRGT